jgi:hypothetical protein
MMSGGRCGEGHEIARASSILFFVDLRDAAVGEDIKPLFFVLVRVVQRIPSRAVCARCLRGSL